MSVESAIRQAQGQALRYMRWLPVQDKYLRSKSKRRLLRTGNQLGKTTAALADLAWTALGEHPYRSDGRKEPGEYWVVCASWSQSVAIQNKLYALLPQDRIHGATSYDPVAGFKNKNPAVRVRHSSGEWSIIRFKTTQQGTLDLAGATISGALFDEPPSSQGIFSEVLKRVQAKGGWISIVMTPIGAPVEWIKDLVDKGVLEDINTRLTPEALRPLGARIPRRLPDGTLCDAAWIAKITDETPSHEVDVRIHGGWEIRSTERYFSGFRSTGADSHVHDRIPTGNVDLFLGIDHGSKPGKQIALLIAHWTQTPLGEDEDPYDAIYVLDEYVDETGGGTPDKDARGILAMLARNHLKWSELDQVFGDRVHLKGRGEQKSNRDLQVAICRARKVASDAIYPAIRTVKRGEGHGKGSLTVGSRWLFTQMIRPGGFGVHPRCTRLIGALDRYTMADDDWKDPVDALRYGCDDLIFKVQRRGPAAAVHVR